MPSGLPPFPLPTPGVAPSAQGGANPASPGLSIPILLATALEDENAMEDLVERAAQQAAPPPLEALAQGAAGGAPIAAPPQPPIPPPPQPSPAQAAVAQPQAQPSVPPPNVGPGPDPGQAAPPGPPPTFGERLLGGLEALGDSGEELNELAQRGFGGQVASVTPQRGIPAGPQFPQGGGVAVPGPNAQSSAYLQSLIDLLRGSRNA